MRTSTFALLAGIAYLGAGVLGLVPALLAPPPPDAPPTSFTLLYGYLLGLFPVNVLHTALHLAIGAWGLVAWRGVSNPAIFARALALLYGVLAVLGMMPMFNTLLGWIPIHGHDVWLHGVTAATAAYFGWRSEVPQAERRGGRMDRRHRIQPVSLERRHGIADRRFAHARMMAGV
jgi:hypothetical protein